MNLSSLFRLKEKRNTMTVIYKKRQVVTTESKIKGENVSQTTKQKTVINNPQSLKPKKMVANKLESETIQQIIDRMGELQLVLEAVMPSIKEYDKLKEKIIEQYSPIGNPTQEQTIHGTVFSLVLGPRADKREVTTKALYDKLPLEVFLAVVKPSFAELDKYVAIMEQAGYVTATKGNRHLLTVVKRSI